MAPEKPDISISDVVVATAGRDSGTWYYVCGTDENYLYLANGSSRSPEQPKRKKRKHVEKVLRPETRVAAKIQSGDKVLNGELRRDLIFCQGMQAENRGG